MDDQKCARCGVMTDLESLHRSWMDIFSDKDDRGMFCWSCWHEVARKNDEQQFSVGVVGNNSGWTQDFTLAEAIDFAMSEAEIDNNIDMGLCVNPPIDGSYVSTVIVRNSQLYLNVAELWGWFDVDEQEDRLKFLQAIIDQLDFKRIKSKFTNPEHPIVTGKPTPQLSYIQV